MSRKFADFSVGQSLTSNSYVVARNEIVRFARQFDPQPFHLDVKAGDESLFAGLAASGWQTAAISMRLFVETMEVEGGIIGLAVDELRWPLPVRPGDSLCVEIKILEARLSKSKPNFGLLRYRSLTKNQRDEIVQSFFATAMLPA